MGLINKTVNFIKRKISPPEVYIERLVDFPYLSNDGIEGKNVWVVGGNGEIGSKIAERFLQAGANVLITGANEDSINITLNRLQKYGTVVGRKCDITNVNNIQDLIQKEYQEQSKSLDILINCAGYLSDIEYRTGCRGFFEMSEEVWDKVMAINLKGTYFVCQAVTKYMLDKKIKGNVINIVSTTMNRAAVVPYAFAKEGVAQLTKGLAKELMSKGIRINGVAPGPVGTKMLHFENRNGNYYSEWCPDKRLAATEDIANVVYYLASDYSKHVVGHIIVCDGGESIV